MAICSCGRFYNPSYTASRDDIFCSYCKAIINREYNYTDREYEHSEVCNRIVELDE